MNRPSPDDMKAMQVMEYVEELRKENEELKAENKMLKKYKDKDVLDIIRWSEKLREENEELKRENKNLLYEIKCGYENRKERDKRMLELEEENKKLKDICSQVFYPQNITDEESRRTNRYTKKDSKDVYGRE